LSIKRGTKESGGHFLNVQREGEARGGSGNNTGEDDEK